MTHDAPRPADLDAVAAGADLRASHEDRDRIVEILRVAAGDGRLTPDELDARLEAALTARTGGELAALIPDLPAGPGPIANVPAAGPDDLARIDCRDSNTRRDGRWVVPRRMDVRVSGGSVALDFTEAVILEPSLRIDADVSSGRLTLVVPPGALVDADDVAADHSYVKGPAASRSTGARHSADPGLGQGQRRPHHGAPAAAHPPAAAAPLSAASALGRSPEARDRTLEKLFRKTLSKELPVRLR